MTNILLIQPPIYDFYLTKKRTIPYGLMSIAGALEKEDFSVKIFDGLATKRARRVDLPDEMAYLKQYFLPDKSPFSLFHDFKRFGYDEGHIGKIARDSRASIVGISSLFTAYYPYALKVAQTVKRFCPDCKIVLGGHHPTHFPKKVLNNPAVDFVIRGEGEIAMAQLAKILIRGLHAFVSDDTHMQSIPGIAYKKIDGTFVINPPAVIHDPDALPLPAISHLNQKFYKRKSGKSMVVATSRGCPFKCSYCSYGGSSQFPYRCRSVASVMAEIERAFEKYEVRFIDFEDEQLSLGKNRFKTLLKAIINIGFKKLELRAMNGLFPPSLDYETIELMKQAGFKFLNLSLGSTCKKQLERFKRPDVKEAFDDALNTVKQLQMEAVAYIIVGAPGQIAETSIDDLLYLAYRRVLAGVSIFYPSPGSADYKKCEDMGILPEHEILMRSCALPISHTTRRVESVTLLRLSRIVNFMKSLIDSGKNIPEPAFLPSTSLNDKDSMEIGLLLLKRFLYDGKIRGVNEKGQVFEHHIAKDLVNIFLDRLDINKIQGVKSSLNQE